MLTASTMLALGTIAPDFRLPDTTGRMVSRDDFKAAPALLVAFICNHCPYVKHIRSGWAAFAKEYQAKGLAIVGINSNDAAEYPEDGPARIFYCASHRRSCTLGSSSFCSRICSARAGDTSFPDCCLRARTGSCLRIGPCTSKRSGWKLIQRGS